MIEFTRKTAPFQINRRQLVSGAAVSLGAFAANSNGWTKTAQEMKETPSNSANQKRTSLHQEVDFSVTPQRIYNALLNQNQFAALTGLAAEVDAKPGGAFSTFGGIITGRNIELVPNQRIVQAWRPTHWDPGVYSIVKFELKPEAAGTKIILDHTGFPEGDYDSLDSGWKPRYWDPMKKYLAAQPAAASK